jgi:PAS domain S-box-containing protein
VESARDVVLSVDTGGRILTWNTAGEKLSGFSLSEVHGLFFHGFCDQQHREEVQRVLADLNTGEDSQTGEWNLITKDGGTIPVSWVLSPMRDHLSQAVGVVALGRDLTERRKFEAQLLQSQKLAALGVMAGGIAHEIRNPLAVCSSAAQFILEHDCPPEIRQECARKIHQGIKRASMIIENLLRFARPSAATGLHKVDLTSVLPRRSLARKQRSQDSKNRAAF